MKIDTDTKAVEALANYLEERGENSQNDSWCPIRPKKVCNTAATLRQLAKERDELKKAVNRMGELAEKAEAILLGAMSREAGGG